MTDFKMVVPVLVAFAISVILGPIIIPYLRKLKMGQTERKRGSTVPPKESRNPPPWAVLFSFFPQW